MLLCLIVYLDLRRTQGSTPKSKASRGDQQLGQVLVFGGADVVPDNLVQAFDPATATTTVIGHMPGPRADLVAAAVGNEVMLLAGFNGSAFVGDVWTTSDGTSFSVAGRIAAVERHPAIAAVGTKIYLFGGLVVGGEYNGTFSTTVQSFDVATGQAHVVGRLPVPLAHARAAVLDGPVLVFGVAAYLGSGLAVSPGGPCACSCRLWR
jgi:hypothetical protein